MDHGDDQAAGSRPSVRSADGEWQIGDAEDLISSGGTENHYSLQMLSNKCAQVYAACDLEIDWFDTRPFHCQVMSLDKLFTLMPLSLSSIV